MSNQQTERVEDRCVAEMAGIRCDREIGHAGSHRGYLEQVDEAVFWGNGGDQHAKDDIEFMLAEIERVSR